MGSDFDLGPPAVEEPPGKEQAPDEQLAAQPEPEPAERAGDALDMRTNYVTEAFIQGRAIDLDNRQRQLYRKYQAKYGAPILD